MNLFETYDLLVNPHTTKERNGGGVGVWGGEDGRGKSWVIVRAKRVGKGSGWGLCVRVGEKGGERGGARDGGGGQQGWDKGGACASMRIYA